MIPSPRRSPTRFLTPAAALITALLAGLWLWTQCCRFPWSAWNDVRLAPSFMLAAGQPVYSTPGGGVIGTWMYGPVPVWLLLPCARMPDLVSATLLAAGLNLALQVAAIVTACALWPSSSAGRAARALACGLVLAVWPGAAWQFLQADNFAVALGLLSSVALLRAPSSPGAGWLSALLAAAAVGCKQTSLGIPLAHLVWLACVHGRRAALEHGLRLAACGAAVAALALACFEPRALWDTLVRVPNSLPWTDAPFRRLADLAPLLFVHLLVPPLVFWTTRHEPRAGHARTLAMLLWACSLPLGMISLMKIGGTINSLQGLQLVLPALALLCCGRLSRRSVLWLAPLAASALLLCRLQESGIPPGPRVQYLREGMALARAHPGRIWFPWHPLITYYSEGRFYHDEDGLYVRLVAGRTIGMDEILAHLPPRFSIEAETVGSTGWGISERLLNHHYREENLGMWRLRHALPPASPDLPRGAGGDVNPAP